MRRVIIAFFFFNTLVAALVTVLAAVGVTGAMRGRIHEPEDVMIAAVFAASSFTMALLWLWATSAAWPPRPTTAASASRGKLRGVLFVVLGLLSLALGGLDGISASGFVIFSAVCWASVAAEVWLASHPADAPHAGRSPTRHPSGH